LDMCCGPGRHSLEFSRRGCPVVGVDITQPYLEAARDSAAYEGLNASFEHGDARSWVRPTAFNLAVNLFTSFGYFDSPEEDLAMLSCMRTSLKPGGVLVMDLVGKETAAANFIEGEWFERDGKLVLTEFSVVGAWEGLKNRWIIVDGDKKTDRSWVQRLYSASELRRALIAAGFSRVDIYGSLSGIAYDHNAHSLVAVARV
ncbi:MAG TPA: class I SAM-dependent methyltransferase, partial [Spirochaetales bacterium]|nr:class I SAM-dependent methyltransferase [Spirochaetales bacterium]